MINKIFGDLNITGKFQITPVWGYYTLSANKLLTRNVENDINNWQTINETVQMKQANNTNFILPYNGYYLILSNLEFEANNTGIRRGTILINNNTVMSRDQKSISGTNNIYIILPIISYFPQGTQIKLQAFTSSNQDLNLLQSGTNLVIMMIFGGQ
jgi:hypothetical protein